MSTTMRNGHRPIYSARNLHDVTPGAWRAHAGPFIINTSHNGNGPRYSGGHTIWCNPPNAAAGALPTTRTADPKVDAYVWVERRVRRGPRQGRRLVGASRFFGFLS